MTEAFHYLPPHLFLSFCLFLLLCEGLIGIPRLIDELIYATDLLLSLRVIIDDLNYMRNELYVLRAIEGEIRHKS